MLKATIIITAVVITAAMFSSCTESNNYEDESNFNVETTGRHTVSIVEYLDYSEKRFINIPPRIGNSTVTEIGQNAFGQFWLVEVTIPDTVTKIGDWSFSSNNIRNVRLPQKLIEIGDGAFMNNRLSGVVIPDSVRSIGYRAFFGNRLNSITIGSDVEFGELSGYNEYEGHWRFTPFEETGFEDFYEANGRSAGTYTHTDEGWTAMFRQ